MSFSRPDSPPPDPLRAAVNRLSAGGWSLRSRMVARVYLLSSGVYQRLARWVRSAVKAGKAVHTGLWLGALSRQTVHLVDQRVYASDPVYLDVEHNRRGLWSWEERVVESFFAGRRRVLVTSAGGGREVLALRRMGFEADGFECNPQLAEVGTRLLQEEGVGGAIEVTPWDCCPVTETSYDGAVVGWGGYMHMKGRGIRVRFLRDLAGVLEPVSPVLLSFFVRKKGDRVFAMIAAAARVSRLLLRGEPVEEGDVLDPQYHHYFTEEEVRAELEEAGYQVPHFSAEEYGHAVARTPQGGPSPR